MALEGKTFVIELGETLGALPYGVRNKLTHDIQSLGGKVTSVVVDRETFAVISRPCTPIEFDSNLNLQYAVRYNIAIVSQAYIAALKEQQDKVRLRSSSAGSSSSGGNRTSSAHHQRHKKHRKNNNNNDASNNNNNNNSTTTTTTTSANSIISSPRVQLRCFAISLPQNSIELRAIVAAKMHDDQWCEYAKKIGNLTASKNTNINQQTSEVIDAVSREHFLTLPESKHSKVYHGYDEAKSEVIVDYVDPQQQEFVSPPFPNFPEYTVARVALFADGSSAQQIELHVASRRIRLNSFAEAAKFAGSVEDKEEEQAHEQNQKHRNMQQEEPSTTFSSIQNTNTSSSGSGKNKSAKGATFVYPFRIVKYSVDSYGSLAPKVIASRQRCSASFALSSIAAEEQYSAFFGEASRQLGASKERLLPYLPGLGSLGVSALAEQRNLAAAGGSNVPIPQAIEQTVATLFEDTWNLLRTRTKSSLIDEATNMSISLADIVKAEAALAQIAVVFQSQLEDPQNSSNSVSEAENSVKSTPELRSKIEELCQIFFGIVKSDKGKDEVIETVEDLQHWEDITRALKSLLNVGEASAGNLQNASTRVQYGALGCRMSQVPSLNPDVDSEARNIYRALSSSDTSSSSSSSSLLDPSLGRVVNVFSLERADESKSFEKMARKYGGNRLLVHGTSAGNITSIVSSGLLVPRAARLRRDAGMLGRGIYFGDCAETALRYVSKSSNTTGSVFILVSEVALGLTWTTDKHQLGFTQAPPGYQSVQGMRGNAFADNEYVIYNADQVRLRYLVEIIPSSSLASKLKSIVPTTPAAKKAAAAGDSSIALSKQDMAALRNNEAVDENFKVPAVKEVKPGLQSNSGAIVPLQKTHVKGRVLDMIGEFTVLQEYFNAEAKPIEAKYVFPLQSGAAVCGFEAYINDKKVVGVVKEKEKARKEYQAAVARGDGAYLMDESEESPDIFTISVGNLPGKCRVIIKVVYIIELNVDASKDAIEIRIPSEVHPATKDTELRTVTQKSTVTRASTAACSNVVIDLGFDMPFEIVAVECTHPVRRKRTVCRANIVCDQVDFAKYGDFVAYVKMTVMKNPRIWVEEDPETFSTSAMITFFPDIDTDLSFVTGAKEAATQREVLLLLDGSASMKNGSSVTDAKNAAILTLKRLPPSWNFNVAIFGSSVVYAFPKAVSTSNLRAAIDWIQSTYAPCFGGTDLKSALSGLGEMLDGDFSSCRRQIDVLLFSDGHLTSEESHTFRTIRDAAGLRVFPFAVGSNSSATTLFSVARVGRGRSVVLSSGLKSAWPGHVSRQLTRSAQLALTNIDVDWTTEPNKNLRRQVNESVIQSPRLIPSVFTGENTILYGAVKHQARQCELVARHTGVGVDRDQYGDWPEQRMIVTANSLSMIRGRLIHRLAAKARIRDWTEGAISGPTEENGGATSAVANEAQKAATKQSIIDLGCEFGLVTPFTSMVAIEERSEDEKKKGSVDVCTTPPVDLLAGKIVVDPIAEVSFLDQEYRAAWDKLPSLADAAKQKEQELAKRKAQLFSAATPEEVLAIQNELAAKNRWMYDDEKEALLLPAGDVARLESQVATQNAKLLPPASSSTVEITDPTFKVQPPARKSKSLEDQQSQRLLDDALARLEETEANYRTVLLPRKVMPRIKELDKMNTDMPSGLGILYPLRTKTSSQAIAAETRLLAIRGAQQQRQLEQYREIVLSTERRDPFDRTGRMNFSRRAVSAIATRTGSSANLPTSSSSLVLDRRPARSISQQPQLQMQSQLQPSIMFLSKQSAPMEQERSRAEPDVCLRVAGDAGRFAADSRRTLMSSMSGGGEGAMFGGAMSRGGGGGMSRGGGTLATLPIGRGRGGPPGAAMIKNRRMASPMGGKSAPAQARAVSDDDDEDEDDDAEGACSDASSSSSDDEAVYKVPSAGMVSRFVGGKQVISAADAGKGAPMKMCDEEPECEDDSAGFGLFDDDEAPVPQAARSQLADTNFFSAAAACAPAPQRKNEKKKEYKEEEECEDFGHLDLLMAHQSECAAPACEDMAMDFDMPAPSASSNNNNNNNNFFFSPPPPAAAARASLQMSLDECAIRLTDVRADEGPSLKSKKKMARRSSEDFEVNEKCREEAAPAPQMKIQVAEKEMREEKKKSAFPAFASNKPMSSAALPPPPPMSAPSPMQFSAPAPPPPPPGAPPMMQSQSMFRPSAPSSYQQQQQQQQQLQQPGYSNTGFGGLPSSTTTTTTSSLSSSSSSAAFGPSGGASMLLSRTRAAPQSQKIADISRQVEECRASMTENIDKMISRGERLDDLCEKSDSLMESAAVFKKSAARLSSAATPFSLAGLKGKLGGGTGAAAAGASSSAKFLVSAEDLQDPFARGPEDEEDFGGLVVSRGPLSESNSLQAHISVSLRDSTAGGSLLSNDIYNPRASLPIQLAWRGESLPLKRTVVLALPGEGKSKTSPDGITVQKFASAVQVFSHSNPTTIAPASQNSPNCTVLRDVRISGDHIPNAPAINLTIEIARNGRVVVTANGKILATPQSFNFADVSGEFYLRPDDNMKQQQKNEDEDQQQQEQNKKIPRSLFGIELTKLPSTTTEAWLRSYFPQAVMVEITRDPTSGMATGSGYLSFIDTAITNASAISNAFTTAESNFSPLERSTVSLAGVPRMVIDAIQKAIGFGFPKALQRMLPCAAGAILRAYLVDFMSNVATPMNQKALSNNNNNTTNNKSFLTLEIIAEKVNLAKPELAILLILLVALESLEQMCPHLAFLARSAADQITSQAVARDFANQILTNEDCRRRIKSLLCKSSEFSDGVDVFVFNVRDPLPVDDDERRLCETEEGLGVDRNTVLPSEGFDYDDFQKNNAVKILPLW